MSLNTQQFGEFDNPKPVPGQLKMFMTPHEVAKGFQPNPNDRMLRGEHGSEHWDRVQKGKGAQPGQVFETDRELNRRKLGENAQSYPSKGSPPVKTGPDLNEWVKEKGQIPGAIHLAAKPGYEHQDMRYTPDKGVIAGGHHRLAAARAANPDMLMPVIHHETTPSAYHPDTPKQWRDRIY